MHKTYLAIAAAFAAIGIFLYSKRGYAAVNDIVDNRPRGIRNNNPTNLIYVDSIAWNGQIGSDGKYAIFDTPVNGLRAAAIQIHTNITRHRADTVRKMITRWAPPHENPTESYISHVSKRLGVSPDQRLDYHSHVKPLLRAIVLHENGEDPYTSAQYDEAIRRAGK